MALSATARKQRSRAHRRGEHDLCDPGRCPDVTDPVTAVTDHGDDTVVTAQVTLPPLGVTGAQLWAELTTADSGSPPHPAERAVRVELCRAVDHAEVLAALLRGDVHTWTRVERDPDGELTLRVDDVLTKARAHAGLIRGLAAELRAWAAPAVNPGRPATAEPSASSSVGGAGVVSDLTARIAAGRAAAAAGADARPVPSHVRA